jgi:hypothetical protein
VSDVKSTEQQLTNINQVTLNTKREALLNFFLHSIDLLYPLHIQHRPSLWITHIEITYGLTSAVGTLKD